MNQFLIEVEKLLREVGSKLEVKTDKQFAPIKYGSDSIKFSQPLQIDIAIESVGLGELLATGVVYGKVHLQCSRCLKFLDLPLSLKVKELFSEHPRSEEVFKIGGNRIDLGPSIEERVLLTLPMKPLCDAQCRGLCPICGQNLNEGSCKCSQKVVDKRLAKLKDWFKDKKQER